MSNLRFEEGAPLMCNMGPGGWVLGRVIALHYREASWPAEKEAPYQVLLEADHSLIYVPEDEPLYCREPTAEELRVMQRSDARPVLPAESNEVSTEVIEPDLIKGSQLACVDGVSQPGSAGYRNGTCHCCESCPQSWSSAELYSEHYRCATRNGLTVKPNVIDLGTVRVGELIDVPAKAELPREGGFLQCPMLVRLPPGPRFSDDGSLLGKVRFDPQRESSYQVEFVAVSTVDWNKPSGEISRLEIRFMVEGNEPPAGFDLAAFQKKEQEAREEAESLMARLGEIWSKWEKRQLTQRVVCEQMCAELASLRELLHYHPRLDRGKWWAQLGGYYMNVHKLLENTLFECELYLGHALTFADAEVRQWAERNLEGCYQKRLLEAARFLWLDAMRQMLLGHWGEAAQTLKLAATKNDGWGWGVNYGSLWISESAARLVVGAELHLQTREGSSNDESWSLEVQQLLKKSRERNDEAVFGAEGHPWALELEVALKKYRDLRQSGDATAEWLTAFKQRTTYWCAQVLGGASPYPSKPRSRREDAGLLLRRLPGHNA